MAEKQEKSEKQTPTQKRELEIAVVTQMITLATSGFGLVAALAWNSVIQAFVNDYIKKYLPGNSGIYSLLIYALIVTVLAVVITMNLSKLKERLEQ